MKRLIFGLTALMAATSWASAQNAERYRLERTDTGFVRMDTQTGEMAICNETGERLMCRPAEGQTPGPGLAPSAQAQIEALEQRVKALEDGRQASPPAIATDEDFDRELDRMEGFFRRFLGIVRDFEGEPVPDRT